MEGARLAHGTLPQMLPFYKTDANAGERSNSISAPLQVQNTKL